MYGLFFPGSGIGGDGTSTLHSGVTGGDGTSNCITGTCIYYGAGGGGLDATHKGKGGLFGAGDGDYGNDGGGKAALANKGGGGGGTNGTNSQSGPGGSGVVIIKFLSSTTHIIINPTNGGVGTTITVNGYNFGANNNTNIFFNGVNKTNIFHSGTTFTTTIQVPQIGAGIYNVTATDSSGSPAKTAFSPFTVPPGSFTINPVNGTVFTTVTAQGTGFKSNSQIQLKYDTTVLPTTPALPLTNVNGSFSNVKFNVPASVAGHHNVNVTDGFGNKATAVFNVTSSVGLSPSNGTVGQFVYVFGNGFAASKTITIKFDGTIISTTPATITTSSTGYFSGFNIITPNATQGSHTITATDGSHTATTKYTNNPNLTISSSSGIVGSSISLIGHGFAGNSSMTIYFNNTPIATSPISFSTDSKGSFNNVSIIVPNLIPGQYLIKGTDNSGNTAIASLKAGNDSSTNYITKPFTITTLAGTAPDPVSDLHTTFVNDTKVGLAWSKPNMHKNILTGYQINYTTPYGIPTTIIQNNTGLVGGCSATGGTVSNSGSNEIHTFTTSGTLTITSGSCSATVLVIAGGGGGGRTNGGGGGAGGMISNSSYPLTPQGYTVTIGAGGLGATSVPADATKGGFSLFGQINATGGGNGGRGTTGGNGGSGGGAGDGTTVGGANVLNQGNRGGNSTAAAGAPASGGGGAGAKGGNSAVNTGGNGGVGLSNSISGNPITYAGGGGGSVNNGQTTGTGGAGGGGDAKTGGVNGNAGSPNTGGGGGGTDSGTGGAGGTGIVIVSFSKQVVTNTAITVSNLQPNTQYSFRIGVWTTNSSNPYGNILNVQTSTAFTPGSTINPSANLTLGTLNFNSSNPVTIPIKFQRVDTGNNTVLTVIYPSNYNLNCDFNYKFAQTNKTYSNIPRIQTGNNVESIFQFINSTNEVIYVTCTDVNTGTTGKDVITQTNFPMIQQIKDFRAGKFGTAGQFGAIDLITLIVVITAMIGFNRVNEAAGVIFTIFVVGALAFFQIITWPTVFAAAIAVIVLVAVTSHRKIPSI